MSLRVSREELDLDLTMGSGQVFTWTRREPGVWQGPLGGRLTQISLQNEQLGYCGAEEHEIRRFLRLDESLEQNRIAWCAKRPEIAPFLRHTQGLRLLKPDNPLEVIFSFICSANNHLSRITSMVRFLQGVAETAGLFPGLSELNLLSEAELRLNGFGYRAKSVRETASQLMFRGGATYLDHLRDLSYGELRSELLQLAGVGPKVADCIALLAFDHHDAIPLDTHMWSALQATYGFEENRRTSKAYQEAADLLRKDFGNQAGWVQLHLYFGHRLHSRKAQASD